MPHQAPLIQSIDRPSYLTETVELHEPIIGLPVVDESLAEGGRGVTSVTAPHRAWQGGRGVTSVKLLVTALHRTAAAGPFPGTPLHWDD